MPRVCQITGQRTRSGNNVSHSNRKTKRTFKPNIFKKRIFDAETNTFVTLKVSARGLRTLRKKALV